MKTRKVSFAQQRQAMVDNQVIARGISDPAVLNAMRVVPRHLFVPETYRAEAYEDHPLPIGEKQTISQPFIVAAMIQSLHLSPRDRVLEIGTGCGYQTAVLAEIAAEVYSMEIIEKLGRHAETTLRELGYRNVFIRIADGYRGWPERSPFDAVILAAAPDHVPESLVEQLKTGGRMVLPLGDRDQTLTVITKTPAGIIREDRFGVRFVPMTGEAGQKGLLS